jgi:uncharacterized surface protein with fasciclin (FAS1) repeats
MIVGAACSDDATESADETTTTSAPADEPSADETTTTSAPADEPSADEASEEAVSGTIVDVATEAGSFSTLLAAAETAGLVDTLSGDEPLTVFAPTDDAFAAALDELGLTAEELLASDDLAGILTYHVVPGSVLAADVVGLDGQSVATVNGAEVVISVDGETVMVDDATVTTADVMASNGVIHVIDSVLLP